MKIYTLHVEQIVPQPLDEVFSFFSRPENLAEITPASMGFVIITPSPIEMKSGALISYTIRLLFTRVRWTSLITLYEPPHKFVDEQLRGPYSFWHHTHTFSKTAEGTLIVDDVRYAIPLSFIGRVVHSLFIRRQLRRIFTYRAEAVGRVFSVSGKNNSKTDLNSISFGGIKL